MTVTARGEASFSITFPAVYQPSPQQAVTPDAQDGALSPASTGGGRAGGVPFVTIAALLAIALVGGAAVYTRNRRRAVAAAPGLALPLHSTFEPAATPSPPVPRTSPSSVAGAG